MKGLKIIKAVYYDPARGQSKGRNVTKKLSAIIKDNVLVYEKAYNDIFEDPFRNVPKKLFIKLKYNGRKYTEIYNENETISLPRQLKLIEKRKIDINNPWLIVIVGGIVVGIVLLIISSLYSPASINDFEDNNIEPSVEGESVSTSTVFYIGWGDGSFARKCKSKTNECEIVHSFTEMDAVELPYAGIDDLPEWINMSEYCGEKCFSHKEIFTEDPKTSVILADWQDRVALIVCRDNTYGSGLLTWSEAQPAIVTAKHVIDKTEPCEVYIPNQGYKDMAINFFNKHEELDLGIILLGEYNDAVNNLAKEPINVCEGELGEEILFLGYPEQIMKLLMEGKINRSSVDVGTISNQTVEKYFLTDDIGHGYSGGIAIKKENGCYLGVPTGVVPGTDRIGDTGIILKITNLKYDMVKGFNF